ncbi:FAD-dependent oxidoreductase [Zoogloea sp.]|uniref:FAD-dependent oxidoreductase n=1 Tax=Zoogloea sp. TaxID=49181 RepID=UPI0035B03F2A
MKRVGSLAELAPPTEFDVAVIGAGGAGLSAALFAALRGARVLIVERTPRIGGTTALSAATTWVPGTHHCARVNPDDTLAEASKYLDKAVGERTPARLRAAFLSHGPDAVRELESRTEVRYRPYPKHPDYITDLPGATLAGRALEPLPFDGRLLGEWFELLREPIPEFTVLGGMMVDRNDINNLLGMTRSWRALRHSIGIIGRHLSDRLRYRRGTRLVMGNALIARLVYSLCAHDQVRICLETELKGLTHGPAGVTGLELERAGERVAVQIKRGVILAAGGFNRNPALRAELLPGVDEAWCPAAPGHTGTAQQLALGLGAVHGPTHETPAFWAPVSLRRRPDGSQAVFPHFVMDRAKPGMITVNQAGRRFVNESTSYHLFALAMERSLHAKEHCSKGTPGQAPCQSIAVPAYLICDARALRQYGLGMVRPGGRGLDPFLMDGYLIQGDTLPELAARLGLDSQVLCQTIEEFNTQARQGSDPRFGRGTTAYQRNIGDATWPGPNPCMGPLEEGPFYAVRLYPGDIGASTGLATDEHARVLKADGSPIRGLYAVGNEMHSIMGGVYTAPGITIGPGMVFASLAVGDLMG